MKKADSIKNLISSIIERKNWSKKISQHAVFDLWPEMVGRDIAQRASPYVLRGSVLWVRVSDSVWMQQLHLQKPLLLDKINGRLRDSVISDLRFQVDSSLDRVLLEDNRENEDGGESLEDPEESEGFDEMLQSVTDDKEIQKAVKKCWERLRRARVKNSANHSPRE